MDAVLATLIDRIDSAARIAVDTEADSLHNYFEKVCLIQLSIAGEHYLVDPLAGVELRGFLEALAAKPLIFHAGDYDLRILRASTGFRPSGDIFDTMIAAQLLGIEQIGLAALLERCFRHYHRQRRPEVRLVAAAVERKAIALRGQRHASSRSAGRAHGK